MQNTIRQWVHRGEAYESYWPTSADDKRKSEAISRIRSLYDAGTPLFTKKSIKHLHQQLQKSAEIGKRVSVEAVDGNAVSFKIETGLTQEADEPELEMILYKVSSVGVSSYLSNKL